MRNKEEIKDYFINDKFNIDRLIEQYYNYVYVVINNFKNINMSKEDIEEIISDVFVAIWKNRNKIKDNVVISAYLVGITKNIISKRYRNVEVTYSINEYEGKLFDTLDIDKIIILKEQNDFIQNTLKEMKEEEYRIFIMFYYEGKKVNEIAKDLRISISKVKVSLNRIRKKIKKSLKKGGYNYE